MRGYQFKQAVETTLRKLESTLSGQGKRFKIRSIEWAPITTAQVSANFDIRLADVADHLHVETATLDKYLGFVIHVTSSGGNGMITCRRRLSRNTRK